MAVKQLKGKLSAQQLTDPGARKLLTRLCIYQGLYKDSEHKTFLYLCALVPYISFIALVHVSTSSTFCAADTHLIMYCFVTHLWSEHVW
jgi:hypothetical protein